jgi:hypothetical protein
MSFGGPVSCFFERPVILIVFVVITAVNSLLSGLTNATPDAWTVGLSAVAVYGLLAYFTYKRYRLATYAIIFVMLFTGIGTVFDASAALFDGVSRAVFTELGVLAVGAYMIFGGLLLFHGRNDKG